MAAGPSRRFQNLITQDRFTGAKSLRCVDLTRQLFGNTSEAPPAAESCNQKMEKVRLPCPIFTFQGAAPNDPRNNKIDCFPLAGRKMLWADHLGRPFLFDAETRQMDIMPCLHRPKSTPLSLFVPNAAADADYADDSDDDDGLHHLPGSGSSLFVMERIPRPEEVSGSEQGGGQFEAFVYCKSTVSSYYTKSWQWKLPPPPYVRQIKHCNSGSQPEIGSYAVVSIAGGDSSSQVCISVDGVGTYCLDTASHTWSQVGEWTLPFRGKAEYVPELNLWFGLSAGGAGDLVAADLSAMDSRPKIVGAWKELCCLPEGWKECKDYQLVNLGSGKFCIARFFRATTTKDGPSRKGSSGEDFAVLTGVEVVPLLHGSESNGSSNGRVDLRMMCHKSKRVNDTTVEVF